MRASPSPKKRAATFSFHHSFDNAVYEVSQKVHEYFGQLELKCIREQFPDAEFPSLLNELCAGFGLRILRNHSVASERIHSASQQQSSRIVITDEDLKDETHQGVIRLLVSGSVPEICGFMSCVCLTHKSATGTLVYTPILGGCVAVSASELYYDRELKTLFCWRNFPKDVLYELQFAFILRMLIDAAWWLAPDDVSEESRRFVSIPMGDLLTFPLESFEILNEMGELVAAQHFEPVEGAKPIPHTATKCSCVKLLRQNAYSKSHILIAAPRLRSFIVELFNGKKRAGSNPVHKSVISGSPSQAVRDVLKLVREKSNRSASSHGSGNSTRKRQHVLECGEIPLSTKRRMVDDAGPVLSTPLEQHQAKERVYTIESSSEPASPLETEAEHEDEEIENQRFIDLFAKSAAAEPLHARAFKSVPTYRGVAVKPPPIAPISNTTAVKRPPVYAISMPVRVSMPPTARPPSITTKNQPYFVCLPSSGLDGENEHKPQPIAMVPRCSPSRIYPTNPPQENPSFVVEID